MVVHWITRYLVGCHGHPRDNKYEPKGKHPISKNANIYAVIFTLYWSLEPDVPAFSACLILLSPELYWFQNSVVQRLFNFDN